MGFKAIESFRQPDIEFRRDRYVEGLLIRVIVCVCFIVVFALTAELIPGGNRRHFAVAIAMLIALIAVNYPFWLLGKNRQFPLNHFYGHWALDLFLVTLVLHTLGGVELPCGFVGYMIMILTSAVLLSQRASFIIATGSTVCYDGLVILEHLGIISEQSQIWDHHYTLAAKVVIVLASNVFFYLFAYLAGSLSEQLKKANTALASAQDELKEYNRVLEDNVRRRTLALEAKTQEIEEFVHIVTHDLRNVSVGTVEVARRLLHAENHNLSARGQRYAKDLLEDTRTMNEMLTQLLALFRVDHENRQVKSVNMNELVGSIVAANARRIEEKRLVISVGAMPELAIDPAQMSHVMSNLIDNAIKYTGDKDHGEISVTCGVEPEKYTFIIKDNGIGMPPTQRARIFQMYHRGPKQDVKGVRTDGQGVGLTITKRIVERWGGTIWVESAEGEGSIFYFTYPRLEQNQKQVV